EESPAAPPPESDSEPIVELLLTEPIAVQSTEPEPELTPAQVPELPPGEPPVAQSPKSDSALVPEPLPEEQAAEILSEEPVVTRLPAPDAEVVSAESVVAPTPEDEHEPDAEQAAEAPSSEVIPEALPEEQPAAPPANAEPEPHKSLAAPSKNGFTIDGERNAPSRILDSRPCSCVNVGSDGSYDFFNVQFSDVDTDGAEGEQITRKLIACEANQNPTLAHIISNTDSYVVGGYVRNEDRDMAAAGHTLYGNGGIWECYLMNYANIALQTESAMLIYIFTWPDERPEILPQHLWNPQGISAIEDEAFADKCLSVYQCSSISRTVEDLGASENMSDFTLISAVSGKVVTADNGRKVHLLAVLLEKNDDKSEQRKLIIAVPVSDETPIDRNYHPIVIAAAGRKTIESNVEFADGIRLTRVEAETFGRYKFTCYGLDGKQICQHVIAMHSWDVLDYVYYCITQNEVTFTAITFSEMAKLDEFAFDGIVTFSKCTFSGGTAMAFHSVTTDVRFDRCTFNCEELCFAECKELKRIRITPPDYIDSLPKLSLCPGTDEQIAVEIGGLWSDCDKLNGARAQLLVGEGLNACVFDHNACVVSTGIPANLEQVTFVVVDGGDQFTGANGPGCLRMKFYAGDMRAGDITSDSDGKFSQRAECVAVGNVELNFSFEERFCVEVNLAQFPNVRAVTIFCQWSSIRRLDLSKCKMLEKIEINQSALAIGMVPPPPPPHEFIFPIINLPDKVQPEITLCGNWRSKHVLDEAIESFKRSGATEVQSADEVQFYIGAEGNSNEPLFAIAPPLPYAEDFMENFRLTKLEAYSSVGNNICSTATFTSGTDEVLMASTQTDSELEGTAELDGIVGNDAYEIGGWARYDAYDYPRDIGEDFWQGWSFTCAGEWDGERTERTFYLRVLMKSKHIGPWHLSDPFCVERPIVSIPSDAADLAEFMATPEISHISAKVREFPQCADLSDHEAIAHISGEENILVDEDVPEGADVIAKNKGACKLLVVLFRRKGCTSEDPALMRKLTVNVTRNFADGIDDRTPLAQTVTPLTMAALGEVKRNKDIHAYGAYVSVSSPYDDFYVLVICDSTGIRAHTTIIVVKHGSFAECVKDFKLIEICFSDVTISNAELADITCAFIKFSKCTISKASVELNSHVTDVVFDECTFNGGVGIDLSKCTNLTRAHIAPIAETNLLPPMKLPQAIPEGQMTIEIGGLWTTCEALNGAFDQLRGAHPQGVAVSMDPASVKEEYGRAESTHVKADRVVFGGTDRPYDMIDGKAKLRAKYFSGGRRIGDSHDTYLYGHTCANISEFVVDVGFRGGDAIEKSTAIYSEEDLPMCTSVSLLSAGLFTGTIALWDSVRTFSQMCHAAICIECEYSSKLESIVIAPTYSPFGRRDAARKFAIKATFYQQNRPVATLGGWWYSKRVLEEAMGFFKKKGVPVNLDSPNFYLTNEEDPLRQQPPAEVPST
ncbi:MAG: hypothetical protein LBB38_02910, partial [Puniceicoccales bacterium]|nr:hypothetical protein [Puniceicoccales bacterium]